MRVNVYSQEFILDAKDEPLELVTKMGADENGNQVPFFGVRMYLHSADELHHTDDDDDRSAVTYWLPKSAINREKMAHMFHDIARHLYDSVEMGEMG